MYIIVWVLVMSRNESQDVMKHNAELTSHLNHKFLPDESTSRTLTLKVVFCTYFPLILHCFRLDKTLLADIVHVSLSLRLKLLLRPYYIPSNSAASNKDHVSSTVYILNTFRYISERLSLVELMMIPAAIDYSNMIL